MARTPDQSPDSTDKRVPEPVRADPLAGELVTDTFDYDGGRKVTVYLPSARPEAIVFAGDGQVISQWGGYLEAAAAPPTVIVGAYRAGGEDELVRLREYSAPFDAARFKAHERFFVSDLAEWVRSRFDLALPAERTAVCGVSASAELSIAMGLRHPDRYGTVFAASPGAGYRPPAIMPSALPRVYLTAGTLEPFFLENARRWAEAFRGAGADVVMREPVGDHGDPFWPAEFVSMVKWAFGSRQESTPHALE